MTNLLALVLLTAATPHLVAHWSGDGNVKDSVSGQTGKAMGGLVFVPGPFGKAFDFDGANSVVFVPDSDRFKLTQGLSLSCWIWLRGKPKDGSAGGAQIVFRGDDRAGLDPYRLDVSNDMQWQFGIEDDANGDCTLRFPAVLREWTHLCGTWDGATGRMCLYVNGDLVASQVTDVKPIKDLDIHYHPGISIGNVQNPFGHTHYEPLNASVAEIKIYDGALAKPDFVRPK